MPYKENSVKRKFHKEYYQQNKLAFKNTRLKLKYGISLVEYNDLLVNQDFSCALCERHFSELKRGLFVDHDHLTGKVRGLLCNSCNSALGMLGDNVEGLQKALRYLEK